MPGDAVHVDGDAGFVEVRGVGTAVFDGEQGVGVLGDGGAGGACPVPVVVEDAPVPVAVGDGVVVAGGGDDVGLGDPVHGAGFDGFPEVLVGLPGGVVVVVFSHAEGELLDVAGETVEVRAGVLGQMRAVEGFVVGVDAAVGDADDDARVRVVVGVGAKRDGIVLPGGLARGGFGCGG